MNKRSPGFTLVEILVVTVVAGVMLAAIYQTLIVQQRSYRQQVAVTDARQTSRTGVDLLATELREVSAGAADLVMTTPDSLTFRAYRKVGIVCEIAGGNIRVWELGEPFAADDEFFIFTEGADNTTADDDGWQNGRVTGVAAAACPAAWGGYASVELSTTAMDLTVLEPGALVRTYETLTYGSHQVNGRWYLGRHLDGAPYVPLIGPIAAGNGLFFRYFRADGSELVPASAAQRAEVVRIELLVRGVGLGAVDGNLNAERFDSLSVQVRLRG